MVIICARNPFSIRTVTMKTEVPTIQDVARVAGVSTATVSRALSYPERVSEKARRQVLEAVERTGYVVNEAARNLRQQRANAIGVIAPDLSNPFFSSIIAGIEQIAGPNGFGVLVTESSMTGQGAFDHASLLAAARVDGFVVLDGQIDLGRLRNRVTSLSQVPVVSACEYPEDLPAPSVTVDNTGGAEKAVRHLADLGHTKIGHITGPRGNILTTTRLQGFRAGLNSIGLPVREDFILPGDFNLEAGKLAAEIWRTMDDRPTAMFCASDQQAFGFISQLSRQGFRVPEDVSVIGFDDIEVSEFFVPALTTISQPRLELGRMAARMVLDRINGESHREGLHPQLDVTLVVRDSTAAPRPE